MDPLTESPLLVYEAQIRMGFFIAILAIMALAETLFPKRPRSYSRKLRWTSNLGLILVNALVIRFLFPVSLLWLAGEAALSGTGLLNVLDLSYWLSFAVAIILLDLAIYFQHRLFHAVPVLWRLHRMHHADQDIDVTTGLRFHPVEILLSLVIKAGIIWLLGAPVLAVLVFEILLNGMAQFNHANMCLPKVLDRILRWFVVTPDFHRVHHSVIVGETNSNFGFNIAIWDRVFGTYRDQPAEGHQGMTIGLEEFRTGKDQRLDQMLIQPLRKG